MTYGPGLRWLSDGFLVAAVKITIAECAADKRNPARKLTYGVELRLSLTCNEINDLEPCLIPLKTASPRTKHL
jgi:hypothetical protein